MHPLRRVRKACQRAGIAAVHGAVSGVAPGVAASWPLPDTLLIGGQKCGTTTLHAALSAHPAACRSRKPEVHYFDLNYARPPSWYRFHFRPCRHAPAAHAIFEKSPYYLAHPAAPARAARHVPNAKLIVLLRDPVARAYSHYWHEVRRGREPLSFADALAAEDDRLAGEAERIAADAHAWSYAHRHFSYRTRGYYADQLRAWLNAFPREQLLILESEDFFEAPARALARVTDFLGLARLASVPVAPRNPGGYSDTIDAATARWLRRDFAEANAGLAALSGVDFRWNPG